MEKIIMAKILMIDDDPDIVMATRIPLEASGYEFDVAYNSKEGLKKVKEVNPDLIILDVMMESATEGFHVSLQLRDRSPNSEYAAYRDIPILMLTAKADKRSRYEGLECGADDYIIKPFDMEELALKVKNQIESSIRIRNKFRQEFISAPNDFDMQSPDDKLVASVIELLRENVSNPNFHLEDACEKLLISRTQLYRKIDALTGYSPGELFRVIRMKTAASLFRNGHKNVAQVMYMVGFNNQSNFALNFRRHFNINPAGYIKQQGAQAL